MDNTVPPTQPMHHSYQTPETQKKCANPYYQAYLEEMHQYGAQLPEIRYSFEVLSVHQFFDFKEYLEDSRDMIVHNWEIKESCQPHDWSNKTLQCTFHARSKISYSILLLGDMTQLLQYCERDCKVDLLHLKKTLYLVPCDRLCVMPPSALKDPFESKTLETLKSATTTSLNMSLQEIGQFRNDILQVLNQVLSFTQKLNETLPKVFEKLKELDTQELTVKHTLRSDNVKKL